jgi:hypothetical protein
MNTVIKAMVHVVCRVKLGNTKECSLGLMLFSEDFNTLVVGMITLSVLSFFMSNKVDFGIARATPKDLRDLC